MKDMKELFVIVQSHIAGDGTLTYQRVPLTPFPTHEIARIALTHWIQSCLDHSAYEIHSIYIIDTL